MVPVHYCMLLGHRPEHTLSWRGLVVGAFATGCSCGLGLGTEKDSTIHADRPVLLVFILEHVASGLSQRGFTKRRLRNSCAIVVQ